MLLFLPHLQRLFRERHSEETAQVTEEIEEALKVFLDLAAEGSSSRPSSNWDTVKDFSRKCFDWLMPPSASFKSVDAQHRASSFVNERLRELSKRPLPVWPVFLVAYVAFPTLLFIVLPAQLDLYWLKVRSKLPPEKLHASLGSSA